MRQRADVASVYAAVDAESLAYIDGQPALWGIADKGRGNCMRLPKWATSNAESLAREAQEYASMTPSERAAILDVLCRDADLMLQSRPDREAVLEHRDPLPNNSKTLLARLRAEHRRERSQRAD